MHWLRRNRLLILVAICAFWTGLIVLGRQFPSVPFISAPWRGEQAFEDLLRKEGRKTPTRADFVLLGLDQTTMEMPPLLPEEVARVRGDVVAALNVCVHASRTSMGEMVAQCLPALQQAQAHLRMLL